MLHCSPLPTLLMRVHCAVSQVWAAVQVAEVAHVPEGGGVGGMAPLAAPLVEQSLRPREAMQSSLRMESKALTECVALQAG